MELVVVVVNARKPYESHDMTKLRFRLRGIEASCYYVAVYVITNSEAIVLF